MSVEKEIEELEQRRQKLLDRVAQMDLIHEDLVVVQKLDSLQASTCLSFADSTKADRIKKSYCGLVLAISAFNDEKEIKIVKKEQVKVNDLILFNPDSAYSLNITIPEPMPEIWVISIDNILCVDKGFDYIETKKRALQKK